MVSLAVAGAGDFPGFNRRDGHRGVSSGRGHGAGGVARSQNVAGARTVRFWSPTLLGGIRRRLSRSLPSTGEDGSSRTPRQAPGSSSPPSADGVRTATASTIQGGRRRMSRRQRTSDNCSITDDRRRATRAGDGVIRRSPICKPRRSAPLVLCRRWVTPLGRLTPNPIRQPQNVTEPAMPKRGGPSYRTIDTSPYWERGI